MSKKLKKRNKQKQKKQLKAGFLKGIFKMDADFDNQYMLKHLPGPLIAAITRHSMRLGPCRGPVIKVSYYAISTRLPQGGEKPVTTNMPHLQGGIFGKNLISISASSGYFILHISYFKPSIP